MEVSAERGGPRRDHVRVLLSIIAVLLVIGGLRWSAPVTLPVTAAAFLIALLWPVYRAMSSRVPRGLAAVGALLVFLAILTVFGLAFWYAGAQIAEMGPTLERRIDQLATGVERWARRNDLPLPGGGSGMSLQALQDVASRAVSRVYLAAGGFVIVIAFLALGLLEVREFRDKVLPDRDLPEDWRATIDRIATDFQRYILVRTAVGLITGVLVGLGCWLVGVELAFVWGLTNFLLNYIPTLGSILGVLPPTLFALLQSQSVGHAAVVFVIVGGIQLVMGSYVDPLLQGRTLRLSAVVVLLSVVFWGWVWGVIGAFLGVPITICLTLVCARFERTRWIARLLVAEPEDLPTDRPPRPG